MSSGILLSDRAREASGRSRSEAVSAPISLMATDHFHERPKPGRRWYHPDEASRIRHAAGPLTTCDTPQRVGSRIFSHEHIANWVLECLPSSLAACVFKRSPQVALYSLTKSDCFLKMGNPLPKKPFFRFGSFRLDRDTKVLVNNGEVVRHGPVYDFAAAGRRRRRQPRSYRPHCG